MATKKTEKHEVTEANTVEDVEAVRKQHTSGGQIETRPARTDDVETR